MRRRSRSFRFHLGILGALTAIPFLVAGAIVAYLYVAAERAATEQDLVDAAKDLTLAIDREVSGAMLTLKALAASQALEQGDLEALHRQARRTVGILPDTIMSFRDAEGQLLFNTATAWGSPLPNVIDPDVIETDQRGFRTQQPVISNLYRGVVTGRYYFNIGQPVMFRGKPHILTVAVTPDVVLRLARQGSLVRPDWLVIVMDRKNRIIARTRDQDNFVGRSASETLVRSMSGREGTLLSTTLDGVAVLDGYYKSDVTGFTVIAAVPQSSVNESVRQAALAVFIAGIVGLLCSVSFALLYSRYLTPPIWRLRDDALALTRQQEVAPFETGIAELNAVSKTLSMASTSLVRDEHAKNQMVKELNHRVKNSLATVISIARQTAARTSNFPDFFDAFSGRIVALSQSHDALSEGEWVDADFLDLVRRVCLGMVAQERLTIEGPSVPLYPRAALTMGMVLHELGTNAAKYGALSNADGRVTLTWAVQPNAPGGALFSFEWRESGGPAVIPPAERSFGTRFIEESIRHELKGAAKFEFHPEGLVFAASFTLRRRDLPPLPA